VSEPSEVNDARRLELITAAQRQWVDALTDLGGRNTLLYYKDRRAGTLDLASADPDVLERFEKTGRARLTKLFTDADERADAIRRMQTIYRKSRELTEERGIRAGYLATGLARWDELFLEPAAPVLLRGLTITPTRARYDDFDLTLEDDVERTWSGCRATSGTRSSCRSATASTPTGGCATSGVRCCATAASAG